MMQGAYTAGPGHSQNTMMMGDEFTGDFTSVPNRGVSYRVIWKHFDFTGGDTSGRDCSPHTGL